MYGLKMPLDCVVIVGEGAGTVITSNGKLVQAFGARLTGIVRTSPVPEIIRKIRGEGVTVLDEETVSINQVDGVKRALDLGFRHIAVSVAGFNQKL